MTKKAVWFSENDNYITDFIKDSKMTFSGSIKELLYYAIDLKKKNVVLDQNGNVCIMSKISNYLVQNQSDLSENINTIKKVDISGLL